MCFAARSGFDRILQFRVLWYALDPLKTRFVNIHQFQVTSYDLYVKWDAYTSNEKDNNNMDLLVYLCCHSNSYALLF